MPPQPCRRRAESLRELAGTFRPSAKQLDGGAPRRIGERGERGESTIEIFAQTPFPFVRMRCVNHQWRPPISRNS